MTDLTFNPTSARSVAAFLRASTEAQITIRRKRARRVLRGTEVAEAQGLVRQPHKPPTSDSVPAPAARKDFALQRNAERKRALADLARKEKARLHASLRRG